MAGITVKMLAENQLGSAAKAIIYTVPTGKATVIKNFRFANRDTSSRTMNLYYLKAGLANSFARLILPSALSIAPGNVVVEDNELTMAQDDMILGDASVAAKIDYLISGIERDA